MSTPVKISRALMQGIGGLVVENTAAPGTGFNPIIHTAPIPADIRLALEAEEVEWGYSEEYQALAKAARSKLWPVWYSSQGLTIGSTPMIEHGIAPIDNLIPKMLYVNKTLDYVGDLIRGAAIDVSADKYPWLPGWEGRCYAAATPASINRFKDSDAKRTAAFFLGYTPASEDIVYCDFGAPRAELIANWAMDGSFYEQLILPALMSRKGPNWFTLVVLFPYNATFILQVKNVPGSVMTKGLQLYCCRPADTAPSATIAAPIVGKVITSKAMTDTYGIPVTDRPAFQAKYGRDIGVWDCVLNDPIQSFWGSWDICDNRHGQGLEWQWYGDHLAAGVWQSFGDLNVTTAHVFGVPPLIHAMHVRGATVRVSSTTLSIHQDFVAFDWYGKELEKVQTDMSAGDKEAVGKLDVRTVYNLRSQWTVPVDPLLSLNMYQTAKANGVDISSEVLVPANAKEGTAAITFRRASERASLKQYRILHHFRNLVQPDAVAKIKYTGDINTGYIGAMYDATGASIPWDQALAIVAYRKGAVEDFTQATGQTEDEIRYQLLGVGPEAASMVINGLFSEKGDEGEPEMNEDLYFDHGSIPNPDASFPLNLRAAAGLRFFSPSRSSFDGITNGLFGVTMHQMARLTA